MSAQEKEREETPPLGQRLLDRPFLLLLLGVLVPSLSYTLWGVVELLLLRPSLLP